MVGSFADNPIRFETADLDFAVLPPHQNVPVTSSEGRFRAAVASAAMCDLQFDIAGGTQAAVAAGRGAEYLASSGKLPPASAPPPPHAMSVSVSSAAGAAAAEGFSGLPASDMLMVGAAQWDEVQVARQAAVELQRELDRTIKQRDEARMALSTLRNELYAARQVEKRLRGERDEARSQVGFLRRERATAKLTEARLRKERDQARLAAVLHKGMGKGWTTKHGQAGAGGGGGGGSSSSNNEVKFNLGDEVEGEGENTEWAELSGNHNGNMEEFAGTAGLGNVSPALCSPFGEIFGLQVDKT